MKSKALLALLLYIAAVALVAGAFLPWIVGIEGSALGEELVDETSYLMKRISVGVLALVALMANYSFTKTISVKQQRKYLFLQLLLGALILFIVVTATVPSEYTRFLKSGSGFYLCLTAGIVYLITCLIQYFILRSQLRKGGV